LFFYLFFYKKIINIPDGLYGGGWFGYPDCVFEELVLETCSDTGADGLTLLVPDGLLLLFGGTFHPILLGFEPANVIGFVMLSETSETCEAVEGCLYEAVTHRICKRSDAQIHKYFQTTAQYCVRLLWKGA